MIHSILFSDPSRTGWLPDELPEAGPGHPLGAEWDTYRREVKRLLAEGQEGRFVLIKGDQVIGLWGTELAAVEAARLQFGWDSFLVHRVSRVEKSYRIFQRP